MRLWVQASQKALCLERERERERERRLFNQCSNLSAMDCAAGVHLFKLCCNLSAGTVLQWCSCLSDVETYLPGLCCRGAAVQAVSKPISRHCAAGVQLFKWCRNLSAGTVLQGCSCLSRVADYLPGTVLHGRSCLSGVATYLPALCCRAAAV